MVYELFILQHFEHIRTQIHSLLVLNVTFAEAGPSPVGLEANTFKRTKGEEEEEEEEEGGGCEEEEKGEEGERGKEEKQSKGKRSHEQV